MEIATLHWQKQHQLESVHAELIRDYASLEQKYFVKCQATIEYKQQAHYWKAEFSQLKSKHADLEAEVEALKAQLRRREQQLFGRHSEKTTNKSDAASQQKHHQRKRGQQPGKPGHGRRDYSHLPAVEETLVLKETHARCSHCGLVYQALAGSESSEVIEMINVQAYRRIIHRKRYQRCCHCRQNKDPVIVMAPNTERLLPKSKLGISVWAHLLLTKYAYQQPLNRTLEQLSNHGLSLAPGTIVDGLEKCLPFFIPIYDAIVKHSIAAQHWHADETGWKVFESLEDKPNNQWFLWVFRNQETTVYKISPSRSSRVLKTYFGQPSKGGILNVDRYSADKVIAQSGLFILAFCWVHVRRDFLNYAKAYPEQETWALNWVDAIGQLYHLNHQRIQHHPSSHPFCQHDKQLRQLIKQLHHQLTQQLADPTLLMTAKKLLMSLNHHWEGLTIFVTHPHIPMDNNLAEQSLRSAVVGRKNYYGSGALWSAQLAAALFTLVETLALWEINPHTWLLAYLQECALHGSSPPSMIEEFLPWTMPSTLKNYWLNRPPMRLLYIQPFN
jgi:transposase